MMNSLLRVRIIEALALFALLSGCKAINESSKVLDNGSLPFPSVTGDALRAACDQEIPNGAKTDRISASECYLIMAGVTNAESSWDIHKGPEDWGNPADPARGLTQSRNGDASFLGLGECVGKLESDPVCNIRVGLRNILTRADTLDDGVSVHLGSPNSGAKPTYLQTIERVWNRGDVQGFFGAQGKVRSFAEIRYLKLRDPVQPSGTSAGGYSCEQQKAWGKCGESWMHPACDAVCGGGSSAAMVGGYSCDQQKGWGKCGESWMHPACDAACGATTESTGSVGGYTCEQQKGWGKCGESWMHPVCDAACK